MVLPLLHGTPNAGRGNTADQALEANKRHIAQVRQHCEKGDLTRRKRQRQALLHWAYDSRKSDGAVGQPFHSTSGGAARCPRGHRQGCPGSAVGRVISPCRPRRCSGSGSIGIGGVVCRCLRRTRSDARMVTRAQWLESATKHLVVVRLRSMRRRPGHGINLPSSWIFTVSP
jgi:hypothetical protein